MPSITLDRLRYEIRLARKPLLLAPLALLIIVVALVALERALGQSPARLLLATAEMLLPTLAGMLVAATLANDDALELHLTTLRAYPGTGALRVATLLAWFGVLSCLTLGILAASGMLSLPDFALANPARWVVAQLVWLAPLLALAALGACLALLTKSRSASGALLGGAWLLDLIFVGAIAQTAWLRPALLFPATLVIYPATHVSRADFMTYWLTTRLDLLGAALLLFLVGWALLHNSESLLKGAIAE
ncbi:MAG TPA: hypothetical protein VMV29_19570 [Ktedonobacterales bacterium]|nr:hypothetical protein [Ktedonobacterales bacterium]